VIAYHDLSQKMANLTVIFSLVKFNQVYTIR